MKDARIVVLYWARSENKISETSAKYGKYGWKKAAVLLAVLGILGLCSCNQHSDDNGKAQFAQEYKEYGGDMLVLGLENDTAPAENGVVYLDAIDDKLNIQFANLTEKNSEYILKLFLDYSESCFNNYNTVHKMLFRSFKKGY